MNFEKTNQVDSTLLNPHSLLEDAPDSGSEQTTSAVSKCVRLPEPDTDNITVLTHALPNEPILPWHHYDSPWLNSSPEEALTNGSVEEEQKTELPDFLPQPNGEMIEETATSTVATPQAADPSQDPRQEAA